MLRFARRMSTRKTISTVSKVTALSTILVGGTAYLVINHEDTRHLIGDVIGHDIMKQIKETLDSVTFNAKNVSDNITKTISESSKTVSDTSKSIVEFVDTTSRKTATAVNETLESAKTSYDQASKSVESVMTEVQSKIHSIQEFLGIQEPKKNPTVSLSKQVSQQVSEPVIQPTQQDSEPVIQPTQQDSEPLIQSTQQVSEPVIQSTQQDSEPVQEKTDVEKPRKDTLEKTEQAVAKETVAVLIEEPESLPIYIQDTPIEVKDNIPEDVAVIVESNDLEPIKVLTDEKVESKDLTDEKTESKKDEMIPIDDLEQVLASFSSELPVYQNTTELIHQLAKLLQGTDMEWKPTLLQIAHNLKYAEADAVTFVNILLEEHAQAVSQVIHEYKEKQVELESKVTSLEEDVVYHKQVIEETKTKARSDLEDLTLLHREALEKDLKRQAHELESFWSKEVQKRVDEERDGRLAKLDHLSLKLKYLERISLDASQGFHKLYLIHQQQNALRSLKSHLDEQDFSAYYQRLKQLTLSDPFISEILSSPEWTPTSTLVNEFYSSLPRVREAQLMPVDGGPVSYFLSFVFSKLLLQKSGLVEGDDVEAILSRAEYYIERGDLDSCTREMNQLQGWSRRLMHDWMTKSRAHLEFQQSLDLIETHLNLESLN